MSCLLHLVTHYISPSPTRNSDVNCHFCNFVLTLRSHPKDQHRSWWAQLYSGELYHIEALNTTSASSVLTNSLTEVTSHSGIYRSSGWVPSSIESQALENFPTTISERLQGVWQELSSRFAHLHTPAVLMGTCWPAQSPGSCCCLWAGLHFFPSLKGEEDEILLTCEFCGRDLRTFLSAVDIYSDNGSSEPIKQVSSKAGY